MTGLTHLRRLEQRMTYVRWFGVVFAIVSTAVQSSYPDVATERAVWLLIGLLAVGSFAIWGASARLRSDEAHSNLGLFAYLFDALVIVGFVWVFAYEDPYVSWGLLFILPMEGALRYRLRGAVIAAIGVALFFIPQSFRVADLNDTTFDIPTYIFVVGLSALCAGVTGSMANQWRAQSLALESQSLKLAEVDELKDRFLAVTSHEIRGPLTAIIAGADTMRRKGSRLSRDQQDHLLEMVSLQGHQLARLVDDLQITSQLQSGQLRLHEGWYGLEKTIAQAVEAAASKRRQHQLEMFVEPLECKLDASRLGQIVRNLVENAYKYTPDRTRVSVTAKQVPNGITIEVADDGQGIPADKRDQLFEAFSRIEETAAGQEGVGLGLYVVSQLVAAMKGRIDLTSSARGTTFDIYLPAEVKRIEVHPHLGLVKGEDDEAAGS